jgi:hypothetical protein
MKRWSPARREADGARWKAFVGRVYCSVNVTLVAVPSQV